MTVLTAVLTHTLITLVVLAICMASYAWWLRCRMYKLAEKVPTAHNNTSPFTPATSPIMKYSEFKNRYGSRSRDIAIIAANKQEGVVEVINDFTNAMRENGTLLYHFTHYWGSGSLKSMQHEVNSIMRGNFHAIVPIGLAATRIVKHTTSNQNTFIPTVFSCVRDTWWQEESSKRPVKHITGVTISGGWTERIRLYLAAKPHMKAALVPVPTQYLQSDVDYIGTLLQQYGVTPHIIRIHDGPELLSVINHLSNTIDSIICLQDALTPTLAPQIGALCTLKKITYFSPYPADVKNGAAVAVTNIDTKLGWHTAQKVLSILEEYKPVDEVGVTHVGPNVSYEAHFNQMAMRAQGLDPSILTALSLQYNATVHVSERSRQS